MTSKKIISPIFLALFACISIGTFGQEKPVELQQVFRINYINPGVEFEFPIAEKSTIAVNPGLGLSGIELYNSELNLYFAPFIDLSYKKIYNRNARLLKGKNLDYNAGNYWGIRFLSVLGEKINSYDNTKSTDINFVFGPNWGIQRAFGKTHLLFDVGPAYLFDSEGNNKFFPIMLQLNIGFNAKKW